jgi:hypothetical protein
MTVLMMSINRNRGRIATFSGGPFEDGVKVSRAGLERLDGK